MLKGVLADATVQRSPSQYPQRRNQDTDRGRSFHGTCFLSFADIGDTLRFGWNESFSATGLRGDGAISPPYLLCLFRTI